ncbi:hypothetical protein RZS28_05205 [Methylocapsa polymorpha]|uniref:Uncharacterized protein n=1 Tax=Methylocapsa polymorpha TaxID=3080828 RepID=A0ABZ0HXT6_9HYPH|nr:hypothetical protein RZS28_05205 [Methylocapsa sp. RX1]
MNEQDSDVLVHRLYDRIFDTLTQGDGGRAAFDPAKIFFTLEPRGRIIEPKSFADAWTLCDPNGSRDAADNISDLADEAPIFCARHTPGRAKVSELYEQVLRAVITADDQPSEAAKNAYRRGYDFLNAKVPNPNVSGRFSPQQAQAYQTYQINRAAYRNAASALRSAYAATIADPKLDADWALRAPSLQAAVEQAWSAWRAGQADEIESALAAIESSSAEQVKRAFADAIELFDSYKMQFDEGEPRRYSQLLPPNWLEPSVSDNWPTAHFDNATAAVNSDSDYLKYCHGAGFSVGLWSAGDRASSSSPSFQSDASAESIKISYQYALIAIRRPWLAGHLFSLPGWRMEVAKRRPWLADLLFNMPGWQTTAVRKGMLSSGSRIGQERTLFPLLPQALLAIKNLTIAGEFSSSELKEANSLIDAGASVGWGPFSVSGSHSHSHSEEVVKGSADSAGIRAPFVQIIGWVNDILPFCPPE